MLSFSVRSRVIDQARIVPASQIVLSVMLQEIRLALTWLQNRHFWWYNAPERHRAVAISAKTMYSVASVNSLRTDVSIPGVYMYNRGRLGTAWQSPNTAIRASNGGGELQL